MHTMDLNVLSLNSSVTSALAGLCLGYLLGRFYNYKSVQDSEIESNKNLKETSVNEEPTHVVALVINSSLKMGKGKVAAQCGHAILSLHKEAKRRSKESLEKWIEDGQEILLVSVQSVEEFENLSEIIQIESASSSKCIPFYTVMDAGRTQIKSGSLTVMAIGPSHRDTINGLVGRLPLYL